MPCFELFELLQAHGAHMYTKGHKHTEVKINKRDMVKKKSQWWLMPAALGTLRQDFKATQQNPATPSTKGGKNLDREEREIFS